MSSASRRRGRREVEMETIIGFLLIVIVPISAAAVAEILIRRILARQINKQQIGWELAISEVRSKVKRVI